MEIQNIKWRCKNNLDILCVLRRTSEEHYRKTGLGPELEEDVCCIVYYFRAASFSTDQLK